MARMTAYPVRRNTLLLSATLACQSGMIQLAVAIATTTLVLVTGVSGILGLGPAIFLATAAIGAMFAAGGFMVLAMVLVLLVRPDPKQIATSFGSAIEQPAKRVPLGELLGRPGVRSSLLGAVASWAVMVEVMTLTGSVMLGHHHPAHD